jgi:hypothetical protein
MKVLLIFNAWWKYDWYLTPDESMIDTLTPDESMIDI